MRGTAETPDLILSGEIGVNKTVNTESLNIYENGDYTPPAGVDGYDDIHVDVRPIIDSITIRENGTYEASGEVDGYSPVVVNVPQSAAKVYAKNIISNGNYYPDAGYDGFSQVSVNVPTTPLRPLNVTENGEYNPPTGEGYSSVSVDVPTDPEIESITITENGTYTAPTGVDGYSPVVVNVPQPEDAYYIKDMTPGAIASFDDGADMVLPSLTASIAPVQAGSGDPSPTNVRPISGWTEEVITRTGKNLATRQSLTTSANGGLEYGNRIGNVIAGIQYTLSADSLETNAKIIRVYIGSTEITSVSTGNWTANNRNSITFTANISGNIGLGTNKEAFSNSTKVLDNIQLEIGDEATTYEPYAGTTTTIPFTDGQGESVEVFGGEIDVINGVVTPCPYYASYNGEQLTGEWISDRDVYAPNTTPTTGAQVVNIGSTGTPFNVQPTSIKSLDGVNNVFASTGDVEEGSYFSETPA